MVKGSDDNSRTELGRTPVDRSPYPRQAYFPDEEHRVNRADVDEGWSADEDDTHRSSREIRADIRRTRAELDHTIDELQQRLSPEQMIHGALEVARENLREPANRVMCSIRSNPVPTALIGIGLVWLLVSQARKNSTDTSHLPMAYVEGIEYEEYERTQPII